MLLLLVVVPAPAEELPGNDEALEPGAEELEPGKLEEEEDDEEGRGAGIARPSEGGGPLAPPGLLLLLAMVEAGYVDWDKSELEARDRDAVRQLRDVWANSKSLLCSLLHHCPMATWCGSRDTWSHVTARLVTSPLANAICPDGNQTCAAQACTQIAAHLLRQAQAPRRLQLLLPRPSWPGSSGPQWTHAA